MLTINLDKFTTLEQFRSAIIEAIRDGQISIVVSDSEVLFSAVSPEQTMDLIAKKVAKRISENPDVLAEIQKRLEDEEPEDWDD